MKKKNDLITNLLICIGCLAIVAVVVAIDFVAIPWILMNILSWFGFNLKFWQCLILVTIFYMFRNISK